MDATLLKTRKGPGGVEVKLCYKVLFIPLIDKKNKENQEKNYFSNT